MFEMLVTGKISKFTKAAAKDAPNWYGSFFLTETYYDGEQKQRVYIVWLPKSLERRAETLIQDGKYIGVKVSNFSVQTDFNADAPTAYLELKAATIFIL